MAVAPPIFVANKKLITSGKTLRPVYQYCAVLVLIAQNTNNNDDSPLSSVRFLCFLGCGSFDTMFFGVPAVELVLELRKYYFWRNVLMYDI